METRLIPPSIFSDHQTNQDVVLSFKFVETTKVCLDFAAYTNHGLRFSSFTAYRIYVTDTQRMRLRYTTPGHRQRHPLKSVVEEEFAPGTYRFQFTWASTAPKPPTPHTLGQVIEQTKAWNARQ